MSFRASCTFLNWFDLRKQGFNFIVHVSSTIPAVMDAFR